jgi:hypothetical protein
MLKIEGHGNLFRDENNNAIINCNDFEYEEYIKLKNERKNKKNEIKELKKEVNYLKSLVEELINETRRNQN